MGYGPRPAAHHGTSRGRGGGAASRRSCPRRGRRHPHAVRLFERQLAAPAGGGGRADAPDGGLPGKRNFAMRGAGSALGGDWPPRPAGREAVLRHRPGRGSHRGGRAPLASHGRGLLGARRDPGRRPRSAGTLPRCSGARHGTAGRSVDPHRRRAPAKRFPTLGIGLRRTRLHAHHVAGFRGPALASAVREFHSRERRFGAVPQVPVYRQEAWLD